MRLFGYPYNNDLVIYKDSPDYLTIVKFFNKILTDNSGRVTFETYLPEATMVMVSHNLGLTKFYFFYS